MALQVRRGATGDRQSITFLQGELFFTTDTKKLYAGDGVTPGGIALDSAGSSTVQNLNDLLDVELSLLVPGQVLKWNGLIWVNDVDNSTVNSINDINDVNISGVVPQDILSYNGSTWVNKQLNIQDDTSPTLGGNVNLNNFNIYGTGNILINGTIQSTQTDYGNNLILKGSGNNLLLTSINPATRNAIKVESNDERSVIRLLRVSENDISESNTGAYGGIHFGKRDINGENSTALVIGGRNAVLIGVDINSTFPEPTFVSNTYSTDGIRVGIRTYYPTEALDVRGNAVIQGFIQFGSYTTTQRDAIAVPLFGMVIYNTTTNTFQGYQNTGGVTPQWVDLS